MRSAESAKNAQLPFLLPDKLRQLFNNAKFDLFGIQNARFYGKPVLWLQIMIIEVVLGPR